MIRLQDPDANFERHLVKNAYPGRGLVIGRSLIDEAWLMIYWIMGRSAHSRNRRFAAHGGVLRTEPVDPASVDDPGLIIYEAMQEWSGVFLVTNGDQTRTILEALEAGKTFEDALATCEREPDAPHYTPRISGMLDLRADPPGVTLSLLKASAADPAYTDRATFHPALPPPGLGLCLTTYSGDGNPLPSFTGDPLLMPCRGAPAEILETYWHALNAENRIALAVKRIDPATRSSVLLVRNRFGKT